MTIRHLRKAVLLGLVCSLPAGCGDASVEDTARAQGAGPKLEQLLLAAGEEPGFTLEGPVHLEAGLEKYAKTANLSAAETAGLRRAGFLSLTIRRLRGPGNTVGVSKVYVFASAAGAEEWKGRYTDLDALKGHMPIADISRFHVPGVPNAVGRFFSRPGGAYVYWAQGRCLLVLLNEGVDIKTKPLATGAKAIYDRTKGACRA